MKGIGWFVAGIASAAALAQLASWWRPGAAKQVQAGLDLNTCSREDLLRVARVDDELAERILDNRPYRSKYDLLNRLIVPDSVFVALRSQVYVDPEAARRSVQIALA